MRRLAGILGAGAIIWGAYWGLVYQAQKTALENWTTQQRDLGWRVDIDNLEITGFPSRFNTTFRGLDIADPVARWTWQAPAFELAAQSYAPTRITATWPGQHVFTLNGARYSFESATARAFLHLEPSLNLPLEKLRLDTADTAMKGPSGLEATLEKLNIKITPNEQNMNGFSPYLVHIGIYSARLASEWKTLIDPDNLLPDTVDDAYIDAILGFDRPINRRLAETGPPQLRHIQLDTLQLDWGQVRINGTGKAIVTPLGLLEGEFTLRVENWPVVFAAAKAAGFVPMAEATKIEYAIRLMSALSEDPDFVQIPLKFGNGYTYFGPMIIGPAPQLSY